jgi:membrane peptidoglycan carboxypeptidase
VLNPWRRAGFASGVAVRIVIMAVAAGVLVAAVIVPITGLIGVATRDAAKTFDNLTVQALGHVPTRSEILDSQGHLIAYYYPDNIYRIPVGFSQIAPVMRNAIVAIEDYRFYQHGALDPRGTIRALASNIHNQAVQGGSTLAQQYVKNALILTAHTAAAKQAASADTPERKIRELRIAANVEQELTKNQLLAAYLNAAYFENSAYGIQVAAERYFRTDAAHLTLNESALLAGMVENPVAYDPFTQPKTALARRNTVLARMAQLHYITQGQEQAAAQKGLGLQRAPIPQSTGCYSPSARREAFFCDYVMAVLRTDKAYKTAWTDLTTSGGLKIYTTLAPTDQRAATNAVNYIMPPPDAPVFNPGSNADAEVLIQPYTGKIRAIAEDRRYGNSGPGSTTIDYAVNSTYHGGAGVQTGSSSKIFTLVTALKQGLPFGFTQKVSSPATITPYYNCHNQFVGSYPDVRNAADSADNGIFSLYTGTTQSINIFYALLEQKVGLCNVVKTAVSMGVDRADGLPLLKKDRALGQNGLPADEVTSFTLGAVNVSPMSMAGAYATVAARGIYCRPVAIQKIVTQPGGSLPVESAGCHRVFSTAVADAASHILEGVITSGTAASPSRAIGRPAAAKTGTANSGYYAAFGGYTPTLAGYVSVFNPLHPTGLAGLMTGANACYRELAGQLFCPGQMFGDDAPGATWQMTFLHANLGPVRDFVQVPPTSPFYFAGTGIISSKPKPPPKHGGGKTGGGGNVGGPGGGPTPPGH